MSITPSTLDDIPRLVKLINDSFDNNNGTGPGWTHSSSVIAGERINPADPLPEELVTDNVTTIIFKYEDEESQNSSTRKDLLGCVKLELVAKGGEKKVCHLGILCVSPLAQGKGIGKILTEAAENWARANSVHIMEIYVVNARDDLIKYYERNGYVRTGETMPYPTSLITRVPLIPDLHLILLEKPLSK